MAEIKMDMNSVTPPAPASGQLGLYPKNDGNWYQQTSSGVETLLTLNSSFFLVRGTDGTTGTVNNYSLGNFGYLTFTGATPVTLTGISGGVTGRTVFIRNGGTSTVKFTDNDGGSLAANRIHWPSTQGQILGIRGIALLVNNGTDWDGHLIAPGEAIAFTPTIGSVGGGTPTYSIQTGLFTQRGQSCLVSGRVVLATKGTLGAGVVQVQSLPFTANGSFHAMCIGHFLNLTTSVVLLKALVNSATTVFDFRALTAAGTSNVQLNVADISGTFDHVFTGEYLIA